MPERGPAVDHDEVDPADEGGHHRGPPAGLGGGDQGEAAQVDAGLGGGGQAQLGQAHHHHPRAGEGGGRGQVQGQAGGSGADHGDRAPPGQGAVGQEGLQRLGDGKGALTGQRDRAGPVGDLSQLGGDDHPTSIEHPFDSRNRSFPLPPIPIPERWLTSFGRLDEVSQLSEEEGVRRRGGRGGAGGRRGRTGPRRRS